MFQEKPSRSVLKSLTWFLTAFMFTFLVLTILSKNWKVGLTNSIILQIIKAFIYYIHERFWNLSNYGQKLRKPTIAIK